MCQGAMSSCWDRGMRRRHWQQCKPTPGAFKWEVRTALEACLAGIGTGMRAGGGGGVVCVRCDVTVSSHIGCAGGITSANAQQYLTAGASHVIVTSYVFRDGVVDFERLAELVGTIGKERLVGGLHQPA